MGFTSGEYLRASGDHNAESRSKTEVQQDLDLEVGVDVQRYDVILDGIADLSNAPDALILWNGASAEWVMIYSWMKAALKVADSDTFLAHLGLSPYLADIPALTAQSLINVDATTSAANWSYLPSLDQDLGTEDDVQFKSVTIEDYSFAFDTGKIYFGNDQDAEMYLYQGTAFYLVLDNTAAHDFVLDCGTAKTLRLAETVWNDMRMNPLQGKLLGSSDPTLRNFTPTGAGVTFKLWHFEKNNEIMLVGQMPHDYKEGTDLKIHIHWSPDDQGVAENGNTVGWKVDYSICNVNGAFPVSAQLDLSDACNGVNYEHNVTPDGTIDGSSLSISSVILVIVSRTDTGADDTWSGTVANSPALLEVDIHYETDTMGSRQAYTK